jgi:hypothetical protein
VTILHFATDQNLVFVPALLALLVAVVLICAPVLFAPRLRTLSRTVPVFTVAWVLAAALLGLAVWQATVGFGAIGAQRVAVREDLRADYAIDVSSEQATALVNGDEVRIALPDRGAELDLREPDARHALSLVPEEGTPDSYAPRFAGQVLSAR